jgi:hypothetical protein
MGHALLSPSSASRWLVCTPSARLEAEMPDSSGVAASEGTLAHALGELLISHQTHETNTAKYKKELAKIKADPLFEKAMLSYMEDYRTFVLEQFNEAKNTNADAMLFLEQKLDMTEYVPDGFGTGDVVIIADSVLEIIDLKYGKGVEVSAIENKQMMLYALGALKNFGFLFDITTVRMTIYQPRMDNVSTFEMLVDDLYDWAGLILKPRAALAFAGEGDFAPSEVCRFCKVKAKCKALHDYNLELAKHDFKSPDLIDDIDISEVLKRADLFTNWINAVKDHALNEAINNGKKWAGYKLVEGRSNRVYTDVEEVAKTLIEKGFNEEEIFNPKQLLGITALEKSITKTDFSRYLSHLVIKPAGKATLAPESDKRPEFSSVEAAKNDFAEVMNEN